jgi:hypothetical protein
MDPHSVSTTAAPTPSHHDDLRTPSALSSLATKSSQKLKYFQHTNKPTAVQLVRQSLIHDNWRIVESKKSPLFSTMAQFSVKSLVPPSLPFLSYLRNGERVEAANGKHNHVNSWTSARRELKAPTLTQDHFPDASHRSSFDLPDHDSLKRAEDEATMWDCFDGLVNGNTTVPFTDKFSVDGKDEDDDENDEVRHEIMTSITRRKLNNKTLPELDVRGNNSVLDVDLETMTQYNANGLVVENNIDNIALSSRWDTSKSCHQHQQSPATDEVDSGCSQAPHTTRTNQDLVPTGQGESISQGVGAKRFGLIQTYDNLLCQRDLNKPLLMFVPTPSPDCLLLTHELDDGDTDDDLSDQSDDVISPSDDVTADAIVSRDSSTVEISPRVDTSVQTDDRPSTDLELDLAGSRPTAEVDSSVIKVKATTSQGQTDNTDPRFVKIPRDTRVSEGDNVKISCHLESSQPIDVYWFRDTAEVTSLEDEDRCEISSSDERQVFTMEIFNVTKNDTGYYLCVAVSSLGQCTHRFLLVVTGQSYTATVPRFVQSLPNATSVFNQQNVKLTCQVLGFPSPQVIWFSDGSRLRHGHDRCTIEKYDTGRHSLTIESVTKPETSVSVLVRNVAGSVSSQCTVSLASNGDSDNGCHDSKHSSVPVHSLYPDVEHLMNLAQLATTTNTVGNTVSPQTSATSTRLRKFTSLSDSETSLMWQQPNHQHDNSLSVDKSPDTAAKYESVETVPSKPDNNLATATDVISSLSYLMDPSPLSPTTTDTTDDMVDLEVTYHQFQALYDAGLVSSAQMNMGQVRRQDLAKIMNFLESAAASSLPDDDELGPLLAADRTDSAADGSRHVVDPKFSVDCGLKRVDSSRYRRDYVINRPAGNGVTRIVTSTHDDVINTPGQTTTADAVVGHTDPSVTSPISSPRDHSDDVISPSQAAKTVPAAVNGKQLLSKTRIDVTSSSRDLSDAHTKPNFPSVKQLSNKFVSERNSAEQEYSRKSSPRSVTGPLRRSVSNVVNTTATTTQRARIQSQPTAERVTSVSDDVFTSDVTATTTKQSASKQRDYSRQRSTSSISASVNDPVRRAPNTPLSARALFWQNRISQSSQSIDEQFPELPAEMFKRSDV